MIGESPCIQGRLDCGGQGSTRGRRLGVKGSQVQILSARPCDVSRHRKLPDLQLWVWQWLFSGWSGGAFGCSGGLVVTVGVEGQVAEEFSGDGVDDADLEVLDEQDDAGSCVGSADTDVVQSATMPQGD